MDIFFLFFWDYGVAGVSSPACWLLERLVVVSWFTWSDPVFT